MVPMWGEATVVEATAPGARLTPAAYTTARRSSPLDSAPQEPCDHFRDLPRRLFGGEVADVRQHVQSRAGDGFMEPLAKRHRKEGIVLAPHHRGRSENVLEPGRERRRLRAIEREEMLHERVASLGAREGANVLLDRMHGPVVVDVPAEQVGTKDRE